MLIKNQGLKCSNQQVKLFVRFRIESKNNQSEFDVHLLMVNFHGLGNFYINVCFNSAILTMGNE